MQRQAVVTRHEAEEILGDPVKVKIVDRQQEAVGRRDDELGAVAGHAAPHQTVDVKNTTVDQVRISGEAA